MTGDFQFSQAAEDYARNADIVLAMEAEFKRNIDEFLKAVNANLKKRSADVNITVGTKTTDGGKYSYWWVGTRETQPSVTNIWFHTYQPSIIAKRRILLRLGAAKLSSDQERRLQAIEQDKRFLPYVSAENHSDEWRRLTLDVELDANRMAGDLAEKVVLLCQQM